VAQVIEAEQARPSGGRYDIRGLAEPDVEAPRTATVSGWTAELDAGELSTRQINLELRRLLHEEGVTDITVRNPMSRHSIAVGLLLRCKVTIDGSLGYFACGLGDGAEFHVKGRVGWSVGENMMSGVLVVDKNAGSLTGAALRGGDLVIHGHAGARTGIDQKGGTIIVGGNVGSNTAFMMQRGRQIICGDAGPGLGDSMYDGHLYVAGKVASLGVDCVEAEMTDIDNELIDRKFRIYQMDRPDTFRKFECGKQLYNYDTLEPSERKLVL
jgi:glutamate synthase domain-containing protein 3